MVRGLLFLVSLVLPLSASFASERSPAPAATHCEAWLTPSSVAWVRMALLPSYPQVPLSDDWITYSQTWMMATELKRAALMLRGHTLDQADRVLARGHGHLHEELTRFAGRRGQFPDVSTAEEYIIVTHQAERLQSPTAKALATREEFKNLPRVLLVSTAYTNSDGALLGEASEIHYSSLGEFAPGRSARRVHLMGGYSSQCLSRTADALIHHFMNDSSRPELELVFYSSFIYLNRIQGTLSDALFSSGMFPDLPGPAADNNDLFFPSVGMAAIESSSLTTEDPDGSRVVRAVLRFQGGKTLRITVL